MAMEATEPLHFHSNHGINIRITHDGALARRINTNFFSKGLVFSSRPLKVREKVFIKLLELSDALGGFIYVGFTTKDPENLRNCTYSDLTNKPGYWTWFFPKDLCSTNVTLFYYYTQSGEVRFGIEGEEKGKFPDKIPLRGPIWACANIFGNLNSVKFVDGSLIQQMISHRRNNQELRYQPSAYKFKPLKLHKICGQNIKLSSTSKNKVSKKVTIGPSACVFSYRPLLPEEVVVVQVLSVNPKIRGYFNVGLTSCDPASLKPEDLPENSDLFIERTEYWVQISDFQRNFKELDEIAFSVSQSGEVGLFLNGNLIRVSHVDQSLNLWAYIDISGSTDEILVFSSKFSRADLDENVNNEDIDRDKECMICYENFIDTALYRCGHMCMCYECALEQWQGKGDGHCPLCRALIKDVIRTQK